VALEPHELTIRPGRTGGMGGAGALPYTARGSSVIRMRQGTVPRGRAPEGRGFGTGFSHTVEFSRNVAGLLFGDSPAVPASCHRRSGGTVPRAFQIVKDFPPARSAYSWWSTARHVVTFTQKRRPAPRPTGRQDGHRTAVGRILLALGDLLSSDADAAGVVPERSSVSKNFPACSLEKVAPASTACQLGPGAWTPATTTVPALPRVQRPGSWRYSGRVGTRGGRVRTLAPAGGPGTAGRR
jgi:hypothetical protein